MALPQDGQNANGLTKVTEIPKGKELIFIDPTTNEGGIITLEDLTTQILNKLTSKIFTLDQGNITLIEALNKLNSKALITYVGKKATNEDGVIPINNIISGVSIKNVINAKAYISDGNKNIYSRLYSYNSYAYILVTDYEGNRFKNTELNVVVLYTK
jgi:hypothetical protein|nr:MAG TPA: hypothetical protein [Bacteriophage sp.]